MLELVIDRREPFLRNLLEASNIVVGDHVIRKGELVEGRAFAARRDVIFGEQGRRLRGGLCPCLLQGQRRALRLHQRSWIGLPPTN